MNMGQSMLTLGALILVSVVTLNFYRANDYVGSSLDFDRFRMEGLSMLTSHIEQLSQYYFDEATTDTGNQKRLIDFTSPNLLGFEANDSGVVDDIDDLNGILIDETGISGVEYRIVTNVEYVTLTNNQLVTSAARQYHKRVTVSVFDSYSPPLIYRMEGDTRVQDTLRMSVLVSYWFYN
jgi:hypothetical protein